MFDLCGAVGGLLFFGPLMLAIAAAILLDDGGPVFFRQARLGRARRPFRIVKFRSMRDGARRAAAVPEYPARRVERGRSAADHRSGCGPLRLDRTLGGATVARAAGTDGAGAARRTLAG